ncbi:hypothetical protein GQR58_022739 [Nymphon striatum]|nr:hypothetical protein GQR58_022739 [Nymphon striatum]
MLMSSILDLCYDERRRILTHQSAISEKMKNKLRNHSYLISKIEENSLKVEAFVLLDETLITSATISTVVETKKQAGPTLERRHDQMASYLNVTQLLSMLLPLTFYSCFGAKNKPNQTKPNQTKPNQTKPNQTKPNQTKPKQELRKYLKDFESSFSYKRLTNMLTSTKPIKIESLISVFTKPNSVTHRHTPLRTSHTDDRKDIKILLNGAGHYSEFLHTKYVNIDQIN